MTKVTIYKSNNLISKIEVKGHALSAQYGRDVVCAGISTLITAICNALEELSTYDESQIILEEGYVVIPNITEDDKIQLICETLVVGLKMIKRSYSRYIEISYLQEV